MEDDAKRKKHRVDVEWINQFFGPFCHGTSSYNAEIIDREGLKPREWRRKRRESMYEEELESKLDRVYLASIPKRYQACIEAMKNATEQSVEIDWIEGMFYVLEEIPLEYARDLTVDEDCIRVRVYRGYKRCNTPLDSLEMIGSLGIKRRIPREKLKKMSPREFYNYIRKYDPELPKWRVFIREEIRNKSGSEGLQWMEEHFPQLFEEE